MTDRPGREPEERLPAVRPPAVPVPAERFSAHPSVRTTELSPERAAQIVRQSSNARWVGFLAVVVVILFVAIYWFYELGFPLGLSQPRVGPDGAELAAQQVTAVERGYNVYEANCARCHGEQGEGGIGPVLNRQDKLFSHLSEAYLRDILTVGGRYACGNADSLMPVWADTNGGPLNYRQIEELIAYIRAPSDQTYIKRDEELLDPRIDPLTGEVETFRGWRDPDYRPEPGATPYPDCWADEFATGGGGTPAPSADPSAEVVEVVALGVQFTTRDLTAPADTALTLRFDNQDPAIPHDVVVSDAGGVEVFRTETFPGPEVRAYPVEPLAAGTYSFLCSVHPNMTGTLAVE
ncbi:MAG: c-type cytochrome [Candidatus Limnocylindria bacterium]